MRNEWLLGALASTLFAAPWLGCSDDGGGSGGTPATSTSSSSTSSAGGGGGESAVGGGDYVEVTIDGDQVFLEGVPSDLCGAEDYAEQTVDISSYADGNLHMLEIHAETFAEHGGYSNIFVDSVSILACGAGGGGVGGGGTGGGSCVDLVQDGSFEAGTPNDFWIEDSYQFVTPLCDSTCSLEEQNFAHDGDWWAWFGGIDRPEDASLTQQLAVLPTASELRFQLRLHRCDDGS